MSRSRHLDLGCGKFPRNPYLRDSVYGVDSRALHSDTPNVHLMQADLVTQPLPFEDDFFDSVSAYDFLEHIPRVIVDHEGRSLFPFIRLMNEIWRVMRHDGAFFALTPCYPAPEAFQDPTHVNIITDRTHEYFSGPSPVGRMYGFEGNFNVRSVERVYGEWGKNPAGVDKNDRMKRLRRAIRGKLTHVAWEFVANKKSLGLGESRPR